MTPHLVDIHVGKRLRARRTILGLSQDEVGKAVGITFQQIQKYERGLNKIGSSRLYEFACLLGVGVAYFFEDFHNDNSAGQAEGNLSFAESKASFEYEKSDNKEVLSLVRSYYSITDPQVRKKMLSLIKSIAASENGTAEEVESEEEELAPA